MAEHQQSFLALWPVMSLQLVTTGHYILIKADRDISVWP